MPDDAEKLLRLTAGIVAAHVSNNNVTPAVLPELITNIHDALTGLASEQTEPEAAPVPAVSIRASVKRDQIACLECGKRFKMLKRHLGTDHSLDPAAYRAKWSLPPEYPLAAPAYTEVRRGLALKIGLGRKPGQKASKEPPKR